MSVFCLLVDEPATGGRRGGGGAGAGAKAYVIFSVWCVLAS